MSQAVWKSPLLPKLEGSSNSGVVTPASARNTPQTPVSEPIAAPLGSGKRFKRDLLAYLRYYGTKKTGKIVTQLERYDFSAVRGALIASVPSKQRSDKLDSSKTTLW
ncbi:tyrosyl-DNA phosphodiesterase 1, partial [Ascosphaera aggregata]